jgi:hypothetical protein
MQLSSAPHVPPLPSKLKEALSQPLSPGAQVFLDEGGTAPLGRCLKSC